MSRDVPAMPRLRRPSWRDPRLLIGVVLVLASTSLGAWVVGGSDDTVEVYLAGETFAPGDKIPAGALSVGRIRFAEGVDPGRYLTPSDGSYEALIARRAIVKGELVAKSAVGDDGPGARPLPIDVSGPLPSGLGQGALVDLWVDQGRGGTAIVDDGIVAEPSRIAGGLEVVRVHEPSSGMSVSTTRTVEVLVPDELVAVVLAAQRRPDQVSLVLVGPSTIE